MHREQILHNAHAGMFNNTSEGAARGGDAGAGMFSNQSDGANRTAGSGGAGMFDNSGDTETRPGNNAGMFDNSGASETRTGGGAGMFDNTGDGNKNLEAREHGEKEKGVKGMLHKAKQAFVPKPGMLLCSYQSSRNPSFMRAPD